MPLLVIAGDKDLPFILGAGDALIHAVHSSKKIVLPDVAHMLNMEKPKEFNTAVLEFLKE